MKFNSLTYNISVAIVVITTFYVLIYAGVGGLLFCSSITLIAAGLLDQFELVAAVSVIFALFYVYFLKNWLRRLEPFQNLDTPQQILGRVAGMENAYHPVQQELKNPRREPYGVYDPAIEGFEDVSAEKKEGAPADSVPAPPKQGNQVDAKQVEEVTSAIEKKKSDEEVAKEEFQSATNNLFKIGKMPSENVDGPILDSGSTLMKAMSSFKPEQISAMTKDTKALLETQKGLMDMLNNMRPVLADGKELLQTFTGMFGGAGGPLKL